MEKSLRLIKEIVKKEDKTYTNYILVIPVNNKSYRVAINPKTFGKEWTHPMVRQAFTLLDLVAKLFIKIMIIKMRKEVQVINDCQFWESVVEVVTDLLML